MYPASPRYPASPVCPPQLTQLAFVAPTPPPPSPPYIYPPNPPPSPTTPPIILNVSFGFSFAIGMGFVACCLGCLCAAWCGHRQGYKEGVTDARIDAELARRAAVRPAGPNPYAAYAQRAATVPLPVKPQDPSSLPKAARLPAPGSSHAAPPKYPIGTTVMVKRSDGTPSTCVVVGYDPPNKVYEVELKEQDPGGTYHRKKTTARYMSLPSDAPAPAPSMAAPPEEQPVPPLSLGELGSSIMKSTRGLFNFGQISERQLSEMSDSQLSDRSHGRARLPSREGPSVPVTIPEDGPHSDRSTDTFDAPAEAPASGDAEAAPTRTKSAAQASRRVAFSGKGRMDSFAATALNA